jgi:hypothetical protein
VASRRKKAQQIRPDRSCGQWTDADYALAKELMQKIRLLPEDWADDIVQDIAARHAKVIKSWRGQNYRGWLYQRLRNRASDMREKEQDIRSNKKGRNRPKIFVSVEKLHNTLTKDGSGEHSKEWADLIFRAVKRDAHLSETDFEMIAEHCVECEECFSVFRHQYASLFVHMDVIGTTVQIAIGDRLWKATVPTTRQLVSKVIGLGDWVSQQRSLDLKPGLENHVLVKLLAIFMREIRKHSGSGRGDNGRPEAA